MKTVRAGNILIVISVFLSLLYSVFILSIMLPRASMRHISISLSADTDFLYLQRVDSDQAGLFETSTDLYGNQISVPVGDKTIAEINGQHFLVVQGSLVYEADARPTELVCISSHPLLTTEFPVADRSDFPVISPEYTRILDHSDEGWILATTQPVEDHSAECDQYPPVLYGRGAVKLAALAAFEVLFLLTTCGFCHNRKHPTEEVLSALDEVCTGVPAECIQLGEKYAARTYLEYIVGSLLLRFSLFFTFANMLASRWNWQVGCSIAFLVIAIIFSLGLIVRNTHVILLTNHCRFDETNAMLRHQYELAKHRDYRWRFSAQDSTCTTARLAVVVDTLCLSGQSERALELLDHLQLANLSQRELWTASLLYHHRRCRLLMICGRTEEARADAEQVSEALRLHGSRVSAIYRGTVQQVTAEQRLFSAAMEQNWSLVYQCATENRATAPTKEAKLWALLGIYYSAQHLDDAEIDTDAIMEQIRLLIPRYCDTAVQWNDRHRE